MAKDILTADYSKDPLLLPLEAQILAQYQLLAVKLNTLSDEIRKLNHTNVKTTSENSLDQIDGSATELAETLRGLELKIGLVYTLFKGAVYSLFLQGAEEKQVLNEDLINTSGQAQDESQEYPSDEES
ncbi:hypothetical protein HYPBUDRAFT_108377 [Hyphopichia burtonii NRRL Y-1933]|uniref:DASH complex subunit DAD3 n=1 Tax=Hyphopichia burtonii NRRL Y-1933 TaxID=984485 RepID=A0A1E4RLQ6_9ASCO|nr:hypothetical protein HYPBUDRAFT_108377 [Hyphopichia burtonii NRRL Y-1933]ODV68204.1 hypothetical protein HYPBUDRAFT_108377 [Hyphopichia burtonii NRRL Y-1933]